MNVEFCMELAGMLRESHSYDQECFTTGPRVEYQSEWCRTPGCIAGHAVALGRTKAGVDLYLVPEESTKVRAGGPGGMAHTLVFEEARDLMGLTQDQALALFDANPFDPWKPEGDYDEMERHDQDACDRIPTKEEAAGVVEYMVGSGGKVDWGLAWDGLVA